MIDIKIYSPVEEIASSLFSEKGIRLFIKRDDLIHPFISGNKWRKLKYILKKARSGQKNHLVTFGGAWSNHLLATACAAAKFGFSSTAFVRGEQVDNPLLSMCRLFGMNLLFTDRENYRNKELLFNTYFSDDPHAFFINEGGSGPEAAQGCAELVSELDKNYDHVFCACGTGTTAAGIINGLAKLQPATKFHGVPVLKGGEFLRQEIEHLLLTPHPFELHTNFHFGGYAKTQPELISFIKDFSSASGILLDPVYTGKLMFGVYELINQGYFKTGESILVIHTGGLMGLLGKLNEFN